MNELLGKRFLLQCVAALCFLVLSGYAAADIGAGKERIAAFEATAQDSFNVAIWLRTNGLLSNEDVERLGAIFSRMDMVRMLAYQSLAENDMDGLDEHLSDAHELLADLNSILGEAIKNATKHSYGRPASYILN